MHCLGFSSSFSPRKQQDKASWEVLLQTEISQADLAGLIHCANTNPELLVLPPASSCSSPQRAHPRMGQTGIASNTSSYISTFACFPLAFQEQPLPPGQAGSLQVARRSSGDISSPSFFSWCLITSKAC